MRQSAKFLQEGLRNEVYDNNRDVSMCGIAGILSLSGEPIPDLRKKLSIMERLLAHRGPDGVGLWTTPDQKLGFAHRRLSIIDLTDNASQPMIGEDGNVLVLNGEIYNYKELRQRLGDKWNFKSNSDTEVILAAFNRYSTDCLNFLRGMFAFAIWDQQRQVFFAARDRFGIKPFYYVIVNDWFIFASEAKALLPFLANIETDPKGFCEYITFQHSIGSTTLFKGIKQLLPAHYITIKNGNVQISRYWDIKYEIDEGKTNSYFQERLDFLLEDSILTHMVSDAPLGCYLSGGIDSSLICAIAGQQISKMPLFHGKFSLGQQYDESYYAELMAAKCDGVMYTADITATDFPNSISKIIYHLDYPVAGPGAFPQFQVSQLASKHVKVLLGGQGGDEIFGGYARYLIAYLEQCIKAAIEGTYRNGNFLVTIESIIPQLTSLKEYKPLIKQFWSQGLFDELDKRYFRLIDRSVDITDEIYWDQFDKAHAYEQFDHIFNNTRNVKKESYFDSMTHFDFKCMLPGLLHVEDRVSMAHGVESRVPFLDHPLVEFAATLPPMVKFKNGEMKTLLRQTFADKLPLQISNRTDKMGFPVPLKDWLDDELKDFFMDLFLTGKNKHRSFINYDAVIKQLSSTTKYSRKLWAFLSFELWNQQFHDQAHVYRSMITDSTVETA